MVTWMFALVMFDYPRYPRWSPRCLSPLAYIFSIGPVAMVTMLIILSPIQLGGIICPLPGHIYTINKSVHLREKIARISFKVPCLTRVGGMTHD